MTKPKLEVTENNGTVPIAGTCTSCPTEKFRVKVPDNLDQSAALNSLKNQFEEHFKRVHKHEDANQAAAQIVR
jgi:hypothetical protein